MSLFIFPIPAAPKACGASQPTGALWPLARASSRSASPPATYASLTGGAFQAPSDLDAGGGAARLHLLGKGSHQPAMLVEDLAIARGKRTAVRFRIHAATDRWGGSSVTSMSSGHGAQRLNGGQIGEGPGI